MTKFEALGPGREFELITQFVREVTQSSGIDLGPGDDCAILEDGTVVSCDASVEGTHFRRDWLSPEEIGYRAAVIALSDLAAVAAHPVALFTSLIIPVGDYGPYALELMHGINRAARAFDAPLAGGDTTRTEGPLVIDVTVLGKTRKPVLRSGARPGDLIWVTGRLGGAAASVRAWLSGGQPTPLQRMAYASPSPRIKEALWLAAEMELRAMIDLSDGLSGDLGHIAAASGVGIVVETLSVPIHEGADIELALSGGDDYELCFAAPLRSVEKKREAFGLKFGIQLTRIGEVVKGSGVQIITRKGSVEPPATGGYDHFAEKT